ncbi:hypothetical protein KIPB_002488 [Kipferlia bialata]|uniref:Kelch-type beta propeller n=1 Tax=Kipferlia bialata TaxID=797122 RepID=A0A9K3CSB1_9EUKA|nr:hypothetical protein KIPB_002488 [Kipferlia bialata]|eukprot:g2488.t1
MTNPHPLVTWVDDAYTGTLSTVGLSPHSVAAINNYKGVYTVSLVSRTHDSEVYTEECTYTLPESVGISPHIIPGSDTSTLYVFGGRDSDNRQDYRVHTLDMATGDCTLLHQGADSHQLRNRTGGLVFVLDGHIVYAGGYLGMRQREKATWVYNLESKGGESETGVWREVGKAPVYLSSNSSRAFIHGSVAYVFGNRRVCTFSLARGWECERRSPIEGWDYLMMELGHYYVALPAISGIVFAYDRVSREWLNWGRVNTSQEGSPGVKQKTWQIIRVSHCRDCQGI